MGVVPIFGKTCEGCEAVFTEEWAPHRYMHRCGAPGRYKGYVVGNKSFLPYIPAWCPKLIESEENEE